MPPERNAVAGPAAAIITTAEAMAALPADSWVLLVGAPDVARRAAACVPVEWAIALLPARMAVMRYWLAAAGKRLVLWAGGDGGSIGGKSAFFATAAGATYRSVAPVHLDLPPGWRFGSGTPEAEEVRRRLAAWAAGAEMAVPPEPAFRLLGHDGRGVHRIWSRSADSILKLRADQLTRLGPLLEIAPHLEFWDIVDAQLRGRRRRDEERADWARIGAAIIEASHGVGIVAPPAEEARPRFPVGRPLKLERAWLSAGPEERAALLESIASAGAGVALSKTG